MVDQRPMSDADAGPRSLLSVGVAPELRERLRDLAGDRSIVIGHYASRRCGVTVGDLEIGFRERVPGSRHVELAPVEGVRVFAERALIELLASARATVCLRGPVFARHLGIDLDRPELWIDFLDRPTVAP